MNNPLITVFTPTFNRVDFLPKVYSSLKKQEYRDFEWLIVDDGSSDNTETVINDFILEDEILIHYIKQPNSGKHKAINKGVSVAKGELFLILDSDDTLPKNSLSIIKQYYVDIKDNPVIGGVCGLMAHHDGVIIGNRNVSTSMDISSIEMRYKYGFIGDVCEVFKTEILWEFPFPEIENDKAIFFIIRSESIDFEKEIYFLEKITFDGAVIENKIISQIEVPDNVSFSRRYSEVSFFTVKNDMVSFIGLDKNKGSYIFNFSMNGKLLEKGAPAEIFIPNNYDNSTYYVANNTSAIITERAPYSDNNSLYKDGNKLFDIPYPINQGYFYSSDSIYLLFYDRTESQRFDFINGLSDRPSLYSYFYDTQSNNFVPMYFKYP